MRGLFGIHARQLSRRLELGEFYMLRGHVRRRLDEPDHCARGERARELLSKAGTTELNGPHAS